MELLRLNTIGGVDLGQKKSLIIPVHIGNDITVRTGYQ
jgi:hypothetical protein